jgi:HK97 gp10 family phage protein
MIQLVNRTGKFMRQLTDNQTSALNAVGKFCVEKMKFYAAVDTGYMQSRCTYVIKQNELWLMNDALYAIYQEMGTYKMPAHPFFRPAVYNHLSEIERIAGEAMKEGL